MINVFYFDRSCLWQRKDFYDSHNFLALYNNSSFVSLHVYNAWLLGYTIVDIVLQQLFFETQDHVFLFCETFQIKGLCKDFEIDDFDFVNLLVAAPYLMVTDKLLVGL